MMQNAVSHSKNIHLESPGNKTIIMDTRPDDSFHSLFEKSKDYAETRIELLKLKAIDKSADVVSSTVSALMMGIALFFFFIIFNIGLALLIGDWLGKSYYGFFIVSALYLITGLLLKSFGDKWIKAPVSTAIIKKLFK